MTVGLRLRDERRRLGLTQKQFAQLGGVTPNTQINYEASRRSPNNAYWMTVAQLGVDIQYVLTGVRSYNLEHMTSEIKEPAMLYDTHSSRLKKAIQLIEDCLNKVKALLK